jgi:hypothetical protein
MLNLGINRPVNILGNLDIKYSLDTTYNNGYVGGIINANVNRDITIAETTGNIDIGTMTSKTGNINLTANDGAVNINTISTPGDINIIARDSIFINTIDPANINLTVQKENGSIIIDKAQASNSVNLKADIIKAAFENLNSLQPLIFTLSGNDGYMANSVNIDITSKTGAVFNSLKSINAEIHNLTPLTAIELNNTTVTENLTILSDIVTPNSSINVNNFIINKISGNSINADTSNTPLSTILISNLPDSREINSTIGSDTNHVINNTDNTEFTAEGNQGSDANSSSGDDESFVELIDPDLYLSDEYSSITFYLLDRATKIFNEELSSNQSNEEALKKAVAILKQAHINSDIAQKLLQKEPIASNQSYSMILNALINTNLATTLNH